MRNPKPLEEVGGCETLSPKTGVATKPSDPESSAWVRNPEPPKEGVSGYETLVPCKRSGWVRNPEP